MSDFYKFAPLDRKGNVFDFSQLKDKVVLIVNISHKSALNPQYKELEELYWRFKKQDFIVLAFLCDQFIHQDREDSDGNNDTDVDNVFLSMNTMSFPILGNIDVNGLNTDPVYKFLKSKKRDTAGFKGIKWNFAKFLIDRDGNVQGRFSAFIKPLDIIPAIEELLIQP